MLQSSLEFFRDCDTVWSSLVCNPIVQSSQSTFIYDAIFIIVDYFLKMSLYIPAEKSWRVEDLPDSFIERVISRFRILKKVISDRDSVFISRM
jgi:hypothetical protein